VREGKLGSVRGEGYIFEIVSKIALCFSVNCTFKCFPHLVPSYIWNCSIVLSFLLFCWQCSVDMHCSIWYKVCCCSMRCLENNDFLQS
jgi:hypothetical protein